MTGDAKSRTPPLIITDRLPYDTGASFSPSSKAVNNLSQQDDVAGTLVPKMMRLPTMQDLADNIHRAGRGSWHLSCDVARAYHQLPLDPGDWPLVCFSGGGRYYTDASLPFGMCWAAASCQNATSLIALKLITLVRWPVQRNKLSFTFISFKPSLIIWVSWRLNTRLLLLLTR